MNLVNKENIAALVLCGGKSERMGQDKCFINYHGQPQVFHLVGLLQSFVEEVFISCNEQQAIKIAANYHKIVDQQRFANKGPLTGLLSAMAQHPHKHWLIIACDYPLLNHEDVQQLLTAFYENKETVVFINKAGFMEPLIAVYHHKDVVALKETHEQYHNSLSAFLKENKSITLLPNNPSHIESIDDPQQVVSIKKLLG